MPGFSREMKRFYAPKRPCPRKLGIYYCPDCWEKHYEIASEVDFPMSIKETVHDGCGQKDEKGHICGQTDLGLSWCEECQGLGRKEAEHIGQYETVAIIKSDWRET